MSNFDEVGSSSLKDDDEANGCVLLCNLSEPEVQDASLADCDEPCLLVDSDNNTEQMDTSTRVECSTDTSSVVDCESTSAHGDHVDLPQTSAVPAPPVNRKKRFASHTVRKKQKTQ